MLKAGNFLEGREARVRREHLSGNRAKFLPQLTKFMRNVSISSICVANGKYDPVCDFLRELPLDGHNVNVKVFETEQAATAR